MPSSLWYRWVPPSHSSPPSRGKCPLIPLCFQELEILNTAPLTGIPRVIPVKLVAVEAGGGVSELTDPVGCESADKQVLQVSPAIPSLSHLT